MSPTPSLHCQGFAGVGPRPGGSVAGLSWALAWAESWAVNSLEGEVCVHRSRFGSRKSGLDWFGGKPLAPSNEACFIAGRSALKEREGGDLGKRRAPEPPGPAAAAQPPFPRFDGDGPSAAAVVLLISIGAGTLLPVFGKTTCGTPKELGAGMGSRGGI